MANGNIELYGSSIPDYVADQIHTREEILGSSKSSTDLELLHGKAPWIKLRSSVNTISDDEADFVAKGITPISAAVTSPSLAAENVLFNGTIATGSAQRAGIHSSIPAYEYSKGLGFRPMAGITDMTVTHKNTYGTLFEANVNIKVNTLQQLERFETLYFRPGYTALLEWGNSLYPVKEGNSIEIERSSDAMSISNRDFFDKCTGANRIEELINAKRISFQGNYQGMFGFIVNFSWKVNNDGTYSASIKIVSRGVVMDGLKASTPSDHKKAEEMEKEETEKATEATKEKYKSIYHHIFYDLSRAPVQDKKINIIDELIASETKRLGTRNASQMSDGGRNTISYKLGAELKRVNGNIFAPTVEQTRLNSNPETSPFAIAYKIAVQNETGFFNILGALLAGKDNLAYINMRTLLSIFNAFEVIKDPSGSGERVCPFYTGYGNKYTTHKNHFSVDPFTALVPKVPVDEKFKDLVVGDVADSANATMFQLASKHGGVDDIMNIYMSSPFLLQTFDKFIEGVTDPEVSIFDFLNSVLKNVQRAYGEINDFGIHYDSELNLFMVVDRGNPDAKTFRDVAQININGLNNSVYGVDISTTISKNIAAQVSIAAQASHGNYADNIQNLLQWNKGAVDRHIVEKNQNNESGDNTVNQKSEKKKKTILEKLIDAYEEVRTGNNFFTLTTLDATELVNLSREARKINQQEIIKKRTADNIPDPLPIPVTMSLEMWGISGMKIGSSFRINKFLLPSKYDKYNHIIKGITHTVARTWKTTVDTYMYKAKF